MALVTAPNLIEVTDFTVGYSPDSEPVNLEPGALLDTMNLLPDRSSSALLVREGFRRLREEILGGGTHTVIQIRSWKAVVSGTPTTYIICVLSDGSANPNNVQLWRIDLNGNGVSRIDTVGVTWANPYSHHWGMSIDGKWYGGSKGNPMYSWSPGGPTWDGDASSGNWKTVVDDVDAGVDTDDEYGRDFAFTGKEKVFYGSDVYAPTRSIRYDVWESGQKYVRGDRVSISRAWGHTGTPKYWKSYRCVDTHTASSVNRPGDGSGSWEDYWKKVRLPLPTDEEGETAVANWNFVPTAPETHVAAWHNGRLWLRADGYGPKNRLLYSAPVKPEKGADIPDVEFDPKDFAPGGDLRGPGGGWLSFTKGRNSGVIEAIRGFGQYLLVFMGAHVWVVSGESEESWTIRHLAEVGIMGARAHTELDGLVYFLNNEGLYVTDGTVVEPVKGLDKIKEWLMARIDVIQSDLAADDELKGHRPAVFTWQGYIWVTLSTPTGSTDNLTLVYDPRTASFWKTDLPVTQAAISSRNSTSILFFCAPATYSTRDLVYQYAKSNDGDQDDTGVDAYAGADIAWYVRTSWWPFGVMREQRRIRRLWAVVKGSMTYTLVAYRDWVDTAVKTTTRVVAGSTPTHIEGETFADSHAVSFKLSGTERPAAVYGVAVDTQYRRKRYHS